MHVPVAVLVLCIISHGQGELLSQAKNNRDKIDYVPLLVQTGYEQEMKNALGVTCSSKFLEK